MGRHRRADPDVFAELHGELVLPATLTEMLAKCELADDCWLFPRTGSFLCEVAPDESIGDPAVRNAPHRWTWMIAHGRIREGLPSNVAVRHRCHDNEKCRYTTNCSHVRCCNPAHLYLSISGSRDELPPEKLDSFIAGTFTPGPVFGMDLAAIAAMCDINAHSGCWQYTKRSVVPCRISGDTRKTSLLPKFTPHRWTWAVAHGRTANPLPSHLFHIRRRCGTSSCCNPDHLFITGLDGTELSLLQADLMVGGSLSSPTPRVVDVDPERAAPPRPVIQDRPVIVDDDAESRELPADRHTDKATTAAAEINASSVRRSYASWVSQNCPTLSSVASFIAWSLHPWPETPIPSAMVDAIAAELHPAANLNHPDVCQVAADRLLRLTEATAPFPGSSVDTVYEDGARELATLAVRPTRDIERDRNVLGPLLFGRFGLPSSLASSGPTNPVVEHVVQPEGSEEGTTAAPSPLPLLEKPGLAAGISIAAAGALLRRIAATDSRDLGDLLSCDSTGFDVLELLAASRAASLLQELTDYLSNLSERDRDIVVERHFNIARPLTLDALGARWGVTRERVRQVARNYENAIDTAFGNKLRQLCEQLINPLHDFVLPTDKLYALLSLVLPPNEFRQAAIVALINADGTWLHEDGWSATASTSGKFTASVDMLLERTDGYWSVSHEEARYYLGAYFIRPDHLESYLRGRLGWVSVQNRWSLRGSKRNRILTALRAIGRPATKTEIARAASIKDTTQISNHLSDVHEVVRADKDRWAFADWVEDPYDGIVAEIDQRITSHGGAVRLDLLLEELPAKFGVSAASVKTFAATDAYVLEHGLVRRNELDYAAGDPERQNGAVKVGDLWGQRILLHQRHFEGYSLSVAFDIAYANGIRPGDDLLVPADSVHDVSVTWKRHTPNRTVFVGRVSRVLADLGCVAGETISVFPCVDRVTFQPVVHAPPYEVTPDSAEIEQRTDLSHRSSAVDTPTALTAHARDPLMSLLGEAE